MNKRKHFYHHLVPLDSIIIELNKLEMSDDERNHLVMIVESNVHVIIIDLVLSNLTTEDKKEFLNHLKADDHEKIWSLLKEKTENIEEKIKTSAEELLKEFINDIDETKAH